MATVISGNRATGDASATLASGILQAKRVIEMSDSIALLQPTAAPLLRFLAGAGDKKAQLKSEACSNPKFEWLEDDLQPNWDTVSDTHNSTTTVIAVSNGTYFVARDLVVVPSTGEVFSVTSVSTNDLTVVRGTHAAVIGKDANLLILGNANEEGATAPTAKTIRETNAYNYTQIFRSPFGASNTLKASNLYGGNDLTYQRKKKAIEHARDIENSFMFGHREEVTSGVTNTKRYTGGLVEYITTNVTTDSNGTLTEAEWDAWIATLFTYGSDTKVALCSSTILQVLHNIATARVKIVNRASEIYGLHISEWINPFGRLLLVHHKMLVNDYDGYCFGLDMSNIKRRYLSYNGLNRDTKLETNIQANGTDAETDQYITECGIEIRLEKTHAILKGVTGGPT